MLGAMPGMGEIPTKDCGIPPANCKMPTTHMRGAEKFDTECVEIETPKASRGVGYS